MSVSQTIGNTGQALIVYVSEKPLSLDELKPLRSFHFTADWYGKRIDFDFSVTVAIDPEYLFLFATGDFPPVCDRTAAVGEFKSNLWQQDVAELFIGDAAGEAYQEFNLSPAGAWWTAAFESYRAPSPGYRPPTDVRVVCGGRSGSWSAGMSFPRAALGIDWQLGPQCPVTAAAIAGPAEQRRYLWSGRSEGKPDFHRRDLAGTQRLQVICK